MKLLDLLRSPWAIEPDKLREMQEIYATHLRGEKIDIEAIEARLGRPLANDQQEYHVRDGGVAVLPIEGVIAPKANLFTRVSGGVSAQGLQMQIESAQADSRVRSLILLLDSPGGSVYGIPELGEAIKAFATVKPVVALAEGTMASAAYWAGSAANQVLITSKVVEVGSLGVVISQDYTPRRDGGTTYEIASGRYKRIASTASGPLSDEGRAYLQERCDHVYTVLVDAVADHRGTDVQTVLDRMADGRVFVGQQAIDAGLVDGVSTLDALADQLAREPEAFTERRRARPKALAAVAAEGDLPPPKAAGVAATGPTATLHQDPVMPDNNPTPTAVNRETLERDHAPLFAQLRTEFTALGAASERARIQAVREQSLPGHEKLIDTLAFDGKTTGPEAAAQVIAAERGVRASAAKAHADDAPPALPSATAPKGGEEMTGQEKVAKAEAYAAEHKVDMVTAYKKLGLA